MDTIVKAVKVPPEGKANEGEGAAVKAAPRFIGDGKSELTYELKHPMEYDGTEYRTVTITRLKGKHFRNVELHSATFGPEAALIHAMTTLPFAVIEELDGEDFVDLVETMDPFIPARFKEAGGPDSKNGGNTQP